MKIIFRVPDMECSSCAMRLESLEDELPGVQRINASYRKQTMEVEFDPARITIEQILEAARKIGYHPELIQ